MINVALIGVGYWGSMLKRYIEENPSLDLQYVCNSKSDLAEVWNDERVIAVMEATSNAARYSIIKAALLHDKHVWTEKPLALSAEECEELKGIALDRNRLLFVDYTWTFSKSLKEAQEIIGAGEIGKVLGFEMAIRHLGRFGGGGVYWLLGSHMLSILDMFTPIKDLHFEKTDLVTYKGEVETGIISFESGQIVVSHNYPGKETRAIIYGEDGTVIFHPGSPVPLRLEKYKRVTWTRAPRLPREHREFFFNEAHNLRYAMEFFVSLDKAMSNVDRAIAITRILEGLT